MTITKDYSPQEIEDAEQTAIMYTILFGEEITAEEILKEQEQETSKE